MQRGGEDVGALLREEEDDARMRRPVQPLQALSDFGLIKSQEEDDLYEGHGTCRRSSEAMRPSTCPSGCRHESKQGGRRGLGSSRHLSLLRVLPAGPVALVEGSLQETKPWDRPEWGRGWRHPPACGL